MSDKWSRLKGEKEPIVSAENAQAAVFKLLGFYHISIDDFEGEARATAELILNKLQKAYMAGQLENQCDDKGFRVVQKLLAPPGDSPNIVYDELTGKAKVAMDGFKPEAAIARQHALLGSLSGLGADAFRTLKAVDLSVAECLAFVFFSV